MLESFILGLVQGVAEWLPISSEGLIVVIKTKFFGGGDLDEIIRQALFLHLGTFLAAFVYFRKDVFRLLNPRELKGSNLKIFNFLVIATLISGVLGYFFLEAISALEDFFAISGQRLMVLVGILLLITGFLQLKAKKNQLKTEEDINKGDGLLLGIVQALAVLPGLSRSGTTVAALLMRGYTNDSALKFSFLMSLPIVLGGNIILNLKGFSFSAGDIVGFVSAFVFGLLTINLLIGLAKRINFAYFVFIFAALSFVAAFV